MAMPASIVKQQEFVVFKRGEVPVTASRKSVFWNVPAGPVRLQVARCGCARA
jgi:hypothetical protein